MDEHTERGNRVVARALASLEADPGGASPLILDLLTNATADAARRFLVDGHLVRSLRLAPTVDGRWAWWRSCLTCPRAEWGHADDWRGALRRGREHGDHRFVEPEVFPQVERRPGMGENTVRGGFPRAEIMRRLPVARVGVPAGTDHATVWCDASLPRCGQGRARWAVVTGAGWVYSGHGYQTRHSEQGELYAILQAISVFPTKTPVVVYCDSVAAVRLFHKAYARFGLVNGESLSSVLLVRHLVSKFVATLSHRSEVRVRWKRRRSDGLAVFVDNFTRDSPKSGAWMSFV